MKKICFILLFLVCFVMPANVLLAVWVTQTVDSSGDVGKLAIDTNDNLHICYSKGSQLKYAKWAGTSWSTQTIDSYNTSSNYGSCIAVGPNSLPQISYCDSNDKLRYAKWTGSSWIIQTIDKYSGAAICTGSNNYPKILYNQSYYLEGGNAPYNHLQLAEWTGSSWSSQTIRSSGVSSVHTSLRMALDDSNHPHLIYDVNWGTGGYAEWTGSSWSLESSNFGDTSRGQSIAIGTNNYPQISNCSTFSSGLMYTKWTGFSWSAVQIIDTLGYGDGYTSIVLDKNDYPHIAYYDPANHILKYAKWTGSSWDIQTLDSTGNVGQYASIALDSDDNPYIAYFDATNNKLKLIKWVVSGDITPPTTITTVNDGLTTDIDVIYTATTLSANWTASTDPQSDILAYYYAIGTGKSTENQMTNLVSWTNVGTNTSVNRNSLNLTIGTTYYFSVYAVNGEFMHSSTTTSNGQFVSASIDNTPPLWDVSAQVYDGLGTDISFTYSTKTLSANWDAGVDPESGIAYYYFAIGTGTVSGQNSSVLNWTNNGVLRSVTKNGLALTVGTTYYFSVYAVNGASLQSSTKTSNGQYVAPVYDATPPSAPAIVYDGEIAGMDIAFTTETTKLFANWTTSTDIESDISMYLYAIGTSVGTTDVLDWTATNNGLETSAVCTGLNLSAGRTYYFTVKAQNGAGQYSPPTSSNGQMVISDVSYSSLDQTRTYPNPCIIDESSMKFDKLPADAILSIYSLSGKLVRTLNETDFGNNGVILWNGKNTLGDYISQGIYIYMLKTPDGQKKTGKIAVKRK